MKKEGTPFPEVVDNTMMGQYIKCPELFHRGTIQNLHTVGTSIHLHAGGAFAASMEAWRRAYWEQGHTPVEAEYIGRGRLIEYYSEVTGVLEPAKNGDKSLENMLRGYDSYCLQYPITEDYVKPLKLANGRYGIEFSFAVPIPEIVHPESGDPLIYAGRFDQLAFYNDGVFVEDEKTGSSLGDQWRNNWDLDGQFTGYAFGARQFGYPVIGAIVRGIGLLKTKITHEEVIVYRTDWQIARWLERTQYQLQDMIRDWKRKYYRLALDKSSCNAYGGCPMKNLCSSPSPENWLDTHYEWRKWDPLAKH